MISNELKEEVYNCIKCGLCLTPCPVYKQLGFEAAAPRGKVQLIKKILEGKLAPSPAFQKILYTCLLCETCTANCPSGLKVDRLLKAMRAEVFQKFGAPWPKNMLFWVLSGNFFWPILMFLGRKVGNPFLNILPKWGKVGTIPLGRFPRLNRKPLRDQFPEVIAAPGSEHRVLYFTGCATHYVFEKVGQSVIKVLKRLGVEVIIPKDQMCCGLPIFLGGARQMAFGNIRRNIELFNREDIEAVIVDCATCGAALKEEYVHILEEMGEDTAGAKALSKKVLDISQYLARFDLAKVLGLQPLAGRVTYHDPCHMARGQGVRREPRILLKSIPGIEFVEMAGADACCGGGGTFQLDHPDISAGILRNKIESIRETRADILASGCPGCRLQIYGNLREDSIRVIHPVELLAEALP